MKLLSLSIVAAAAVALALVAGGSSASAPSEILFVGSYAGSGENVLAIAPDGTGLRLVAPDGANPRWAPGGTRLVYTRLVHRDGSLDEGGLVVQSAEGSSARQITSGADRPLAWSPNGRWIAFERFENRSSNLYVVHPGGSGLRKLRTGGTGTASWSADSQRLLVAYRNGLATITLARRLRPLPHAACSSEGAFSPNGRWVAFARCLGSKAFQTGIAVEHPDGTALRWLAKPVGALGDWSPAWSPDGTRIAYVQERPVDGLEHSEIRMVSLAGRNLGNLDSTAQDHDEYPDWSPDGKRIVFDRDAAVEPIGEADRLYVGAAKSGRDSKLYDSIDRGTQRWRPR